MHAHDTPRLPLVCEHICTYVSVRVCVCIYIYIHAHSTHLDSHSCAGHAVGGGRDDAATL